MCVEQLERVFLVGVVVLAEYHVNEALILINDRQCIQLVIPNDVVCFLERGLLRRGNQLFKRSHELADTGRTIHAADAVVTAGDNAQQLAVGRAVSGDSHGGMAGARLELQHIGERLFRLDVGIADNKACLVALDAGNHRSFRFNALGAVDERHAAFLGQCDCHGIIGNRLHDCRNHRDIDGDRAFLFALAEFHNRCFQTDIGGNTFL